MNNFKVTLGGFKTKKQAMEFLKWFEGGGEQQFYDHLDIIGMPTKDGCNVNVSRKGNTSRYYDDLPDGYYAEVH